MKDIKLWYLILIIIGAGLLMPLNPLLAHQPRIVSTDGAVEVSDPEVSKAFYDELKGVPKIYIINSQVDFELYLSLTVPKRSNPEGRYSARIYRLGENREEIDILEASEADWDEFYEPFGGDTYLNGPEFSRTVPAASYEIQVFNESNQGKYVLAIGRIESFPLNEVVHSLKVIPKLKSDFFNIWPGTFALSVFGAVYLLMMLAVGALLALLYRFFARRMFKKETSRAHKNIGRKDRLVRAALGLALLAWGLFFWGPFALAAAGFLFFEAIFSWCGLYAALGKNTCPI